MERENSLICLQGTKDIVRVLGSRVVEGFDPVIEGLELCRALSYGGFELWRVLDYGGF